jgi:serine/threonine-protein kinase HipA
VSETLFVHWAADLVGALSSNPQGRLSFTYDEAWLGSPRAVPISISLPLGAEPFSDGPGHTFFANLLPEGAVRQAVCSRLGISQDNDHALLRAIGGECAGALSILEPGRRAHDPQSWSYEELGGARLRELVKGDRPPPLLAGGRSTRLSLAGAQDKLPVALLDGKLYIPLDGAPSTHILKLPSPTYAHLPVNEAFVLGLAARMALDVVSVELVTRTDPACLLVERYDRVASDVEWPAVRLHQEDFCQALGLPPTRKYELEGGPSFAAVMELVRRHARQPHVDTRRLLEWQIFNVVAGNADAHAKNLSFLHDPNGPRLAPLYDLVSTRHYDALDRALAMGVAGERNLDDLRADHWSKMADELGLSARFVLGLVQELADRCSEALGPWTKEFRDRHGDQSVLQRLPAAIRRRTKRLRP